MRNQVFLLASYVFLARDGWYNGKLLAYWTDPVEYYHALMCIFLQAATIGQNDQTLIML